MNDQDMKRLDEIRLTASEYLDIDFRETPPDVALCDALHADLVALLDAYDTMKTHLDAKMVRLKDFCDEFVWGEENPDEYKTLDDCLKQQAREIGALRKALKAAEYWVPFPAWARIADDLGDIYPTLSDEMPPNPITEKAQPKE